MTPLWQKACKKQLHGIEFIALLSGIASGMGVAVWCVSTVITLLIKPSSLYRARKALLEKNATGLTLNISGSISDRLDLQSSANRSGIRL